MTQPPDPDDPNGTGEPQDNPAWPYPQDQQPRQARPQGDCPVPPGQPGPFPPPNPPPKKSRTSVFLALGAVVVVVVAAIAAFAVYAVRAGDKYSLDVGDCLFFESASTTAADTEHEKRDCSDREATYEVAQKNDGATPCADNYFSYALVGNDDSVQTTFCLIPNLIENSCYLLENDGRIVAADCTEAQTVKVVKRVDGQNDEGLCEEFGSAIPLAFAEPQRTYCIDVNLGG